MEKCRVDLNHLLTKSDGATNVDDYYDRCKAKLFHTTRDYDIYGVFNFNDVYLVRTPKNNLKEKCFFGKTGEFYCFSRNYIFTIDKNGYYSNKEGYYLRAIDIDTGKITLINIRSSYQINRETMKIKAKEEKELSHAIEAIEKKINIPYSGTLTNKLFSQDIVTGMMYDNRKIIIRIHRNQAPEIVPYFGREFINKGASQDKDNITTDLSVVVDLDYDCKNDKYYDHFSFSRHFPAKLIDKSNPNFLIGKWPEKHFVKFDDVRDGGYIEFQKGYFRGWGEGKCHNKDSIYLDVIEIQFTSNISRIFMEIAPGFDEYDITHITKEKWLNAKIDLEEYDMNTREMYKELDEWLKKEVFDEYDCFSILGV